VGLALTPALSRRARGKCTLRPAGEEPGMRAYDMGSTLNCGFKAEHRLSCLSSKIIAGGFRHRLPTASDWL
jgi:hypothetical protein